MSIFAWIVFGALAGVIANLLDSRPAEGGVVGAMILGIAGALVGGFLASLLFGMKVGGFNLESFIVAGLGSLLVLLISRALESQT